LVVSKNLEAGIQLSRAALVSAGLNNTDIENTLSTFRDINAEVMRDIIMYDDTADNAELFEKIQAKEDEEIIQEVIAEDGKEKEKEAEKEVRQEHEM